MLSLQIATVFFGASVLLGLSPGPDNLFVLMQSATNGHRAGILVVLGLCTGLLGHTAAVALGLAAVVATSAIAFTVLKFVGAAYLLYLAWSAWRAPAAQASGAVLQPQSGSSLYWRGVLMNLSNPKVALFFLAFLPQFVQPQQGPVVWQTIQLGAIFMLATLLTFGAISFFAASIGNWLRQSAQAQTWMNRGSAVLFAGLAVRLAISQR